MENEFYEFAVDQFQFLKRLTFLPVDQIKPNSSVALETQNKPVFQLSDGRLYVEKPSQFHYEKVRPRWDKVHGDTDGAWIGSFRWGWGWGGKCQV